MKHFLSLALLALLTLALSGCGDSGTSTGSSTSGSSTNVDTSLSQVERAFATADDEVKTAAARAINAMRNADHNLALAELLKLATDPKLTDQQKRVVAEALDQLKKMAADAGNQVPNDAEKNVGK